MSVMQSALDTYCNTCDKFLSTLQRKKSHDVKIHAGVASVKTEDATPELMDRYKSLPTVKSRSCTTCLKMFSSKRVLDRHVCEKKKKKTKKMDRLKIVTHCYINVSDLKRLAID